MKKILIIAGHPYAGSYSHALAQAYRQGAEAAGAQVAWLDLAAASFDPVLRHGYQQRQPWEPALEAAWAQIVAADHLVWVFPLWWYGLPALVKGFIDRVFLPGKAFNYLPNRPLPEPLLRGKSARLIVTADSPYWYYAWFIGAPLRSQFKRGTLGFCGVRPIHLTYLAPMRGASPAFLAKGLAKVEALGHELR